MKKWIVTQDFCTVLYSYSLQNKMSTCAFKYIDDRHRKTFFFIREVYFKRWQRGFWHVPEVLQRASRFIPAIWPLTSWKLHFKSAFLPYTLWQWWGKKKKKKKILYLWTNKDVLGSFSYNIPILYYVKHDIMKMQMVYSPSPEGSADINVSMTTRWCITIRNHFREVSVFYKTLVQNCNYTVTTWPIWFSLSTQVRPNFK